MLSNAAASTICDSMLLLDWGPYPNDHEDANGQFEMNWTYSDALTTADAPKLLLRGGRRRRR